MSSWRARPISGHGQSHRGNVKGWSECCPRPTPPKSVCENVTLKLLSSLAELGVGGEDQETRTEREVTISMSHTHSFINH